MSYASIPQIYWDEIFSSVVYLINRLPDSSSSSIPYTTLFHKTPNYEFLKVLGCACFPYTRPYNSAKLDSRALSCAFLGYSNSQKGYKCLHLPSNKWYISRHVQFDESSFPFRTQNNNIHFGSFPSQQTASSQPSSAASSPSLSLLGSSSTRPITLPVLEGPPGLLTNRPFMGHNFQFAGTPSQPSSSSPSMISPQPAHTAFPNSSSSPAAPSSPTSPSSSQQPHTPLHQPTIQQQPPTSTHPMTTRTQDNTRKPKQFPDHIALNTSVLTEPTTFHQANASPAWRAAMASEVDALARNQT